MSNKNNLTPEETKLLNKYLSLSDSIPSKINRIAVEIIPPIIFIAIWYYTKKDIFLITPIIILVLYNVIRVTNQKKYIVLLKSIAEKILRIENEKET